MHCQVGFIPAVNREAFASSFRNYACLRSHIDEAGLEDGAACEWSPSG